MGAGTVIPCHGRMLGMSRNIREAWVTGEELSERKRSEKRDWSGGQNKGLGFHSTPEEIQWRVLNSGMT